MKSITVEKENQVRNSRTRGQVVDYGSEVLSLNLRAPFFPPK